MTRRLTRMAATYRGASAQSASRAAQHGKMVPLLLDRVAHSGDEQQDRAPTSTEDLGRAWLALSDAVHVAVANGQMRQRSGVSQQAPFAGEGRTTPSGLSVASGQICCELSAARDRLLFVTGSVLTSLLDGLRAYVPLFVSLGVLLVLLASPMPGRGPRMFQPRDPWRGFKFATRRAVMTRAGGRCEAPMLLAWGRCHDSATEVDHIYPWSRGGPTVVSNGQALCRTHNRRKSNLRPPWWYVLSLERRRTAYSPADVTVRVLGRMSASERATRAVRKD